MESEQRRPSKFKDSERGLSNWWERQQKLLIARELKLERVEVFKKLLGLGGINTRINTNEWEGKKGGDTALRLHHMREELEALLAKVNCAETLNDWIIYGVSDTRVSTIIIQFKKSQK